MAESVITILLSNVNALLQEEAKLIRGVDNRMRSVRDQLALICSFLKDADQKRHKYEWVNEWVNQIRDVAYDMEDSVDTYILKLERHLQRNLALRFICIPKKLNAVHTLGVQLMEIKARLDEISANRTRFGFENLLPAESSSSSCTDVAPKEKRSPVVKEADLIGFDEDAKTLAKALLARESPRRRYVVSIVGMGGLGKTTLAKYVYNQREVKNGFEVHAWVYVSQEYRVRDLWLNIAKQVMGDLTREHETELERMAEEGLRSKLYVSLRWKRYLVVIDDIWAKEAWDLIEKAFPDDNNGSQIMLTTRNREVALYADPSSSPHELHLLNEDESWKLFCKKVFPNSSCPIEFEQLGKKIIAKAGGLPLAIVVLGGFLSTKPRTHSAWYKVLESADWHLSEGSSQCLQVLALSYNDLPYYLKSCFLYFGMFPEDMEIKADRLIQLWIAEGFIQERKEATMEDVAEDYLEELIQRSMVQIARRWGDGSVLACRMHDLLRDLAISEAKKDRFLEIHGSHHFGQVCRSRRLTTHLGKGNYDSSTLQQYSMDNVRSLLCFNEGFGKYIQDEFFYGGVKLLRVLDLSGADISELPKEIGDLILLKYLGLRGNLLRKLPTSIGNLINLQTLDLLETYIEVTPYMLRNMHQLRHLICPRDWNIRNPRVSNRIDHLRNLRTLVTVAGRWINGSGLEKLPNLRHLQLGGRILDYSKVLSNSLANFQRLQSLTLRNYSSEDPSESKTLPLVSFSHHIHLTRLVLAGPLGKLPDKEDFPPNLASLELYESLINVSVDPMATLEKLPNLRALTLDSNVYNGRKMTCSGGGFANLHHLEISRLYNLVEWIVEEGAMPNLRSLLLWHCSQLKVISDSLKHIPTLKEVEFRVMPVEIKNWWQQSSGSHSDGGEDTEITNMDSTGGTWSGHALSTRTISVEAKREGLKKFVLEKLKELPHLRLQRKLCQRRETEGVFTSVRSFGGLCKTKD